MLGSSSAASPLVLLCAMELMGLMETPAQLSLWGERKERIADLGKSSGFQGSLYSFLPLNLILRQQKLNNSSRRLFLEALDQRCMAWARNPGLLLPSAGGHSDPKGLSYQFQLPVSSCQQANSFSCWNAGK